MARPVLAVAARGVGAAGLRLAAGFGGPGEGIERLHFRRGFRGFRSFLNPLGGSRFGAKGAFALRNRRGADRIGRGNRHRRAHLGPFTLDTQIAQPAHQIGELFQRHAGDRQHLGGRFKPGAAVAGAQQIGQTLQHINADRPCPGGMIARQRIVNARHDGHVGDGDQTGRRAFGEFLQALRQRPQHQPQPGGCRFQQQGQKNGELAEPQTMLAQGPARFLIQRLDLFGHRVAAQNPQSLDHAKGEALGKPGQRLITTQNQQRVEQSRHLAVDEMLQPAAHLFGDIGPGLFIDKRLYLWLQGVDPGHQLAHGMGAPHQPALLGIVNLGIGGVVKAVGAEVKLRLQRGKAGLTQGFRLIGRCAGILAEAEPIQTAQHFAFDRHFALVIHLGHEGLLLLQPPQQNASAAVDKSLGQARVQRI